MSNPDRDRALDKIRKLLALASDPTAQGAEAETAGRQAAKLMAKWELEDADLQLTQAGGKILFDLMEGYGKGCRPGKRDAKQVPPWIGIIAFGVKTYTRVYSTTGYDRVYFKGQRCDVEMAVWMHDTLVEQCYRASSGQPNPNAWRNGYAAAVQTRLKAMAKARVEEEQGMASTGGTSLVVVRTALQGAMEAKGWNGSKAKSSGCQMGSSGYGAGMTAALPTGRPITAGAGSLRLK